MKKFITVFIVLLLINTMVPVVYYKLYYSNTTIPTPKATPFPSNNSLLDTEKPIDNSKVKIYNLNSKELEEIPLMDFLVGAAACEMPASYEGEAIKAQMIAIHSYYLYLQQTSSPKQYTYNEPLMQGYAGKQQLQQFWGMNFNDYYQKYLRCADEVKDIIATYDGKSAMTTYFAVSCGKTQSSQDEWGEKLEYLVSCDSSFDAVSEKYLQVKEFTVQQMYDRLMSGFSGFELDVEKPAEWFGDITYNEAGYVTDVMVKKAKLKGTDLRKNLELSSSCFMIFFEDNKFSIATKGYGHGVGMSQFGANQLSQQGKNYSDILKYYYNGISLVKQ